MGGGASGDRARPRYEVDEAKLRAVFAEMDELVKIQNMLFVLTPESLPGTTASLTEHTKDRNRIVKLVNMILLGVRWRPHLDNLYVTLFKEVRRFNSEMFDEVMLSKLAPIPSQSFDPVLSWSHLRFMRKCVMSECLEADAVVKQIRAFFVSYSEFRFANMMLFVFFAPEIHARDSDLYNSMAALMSAIKYDENKPLENLFLEYCQNLGEYESSNWASITDEMMCGYKQKSLARILMEDDASSLQELMKDADFNVNQRIEPQLFAQYPDVQKRPTLCMFAAYFGSIKCLEQLMTSKIDFTLRDEQTPGLSIAHFAVAGGNPDVISLLESKQCSFKACIQIAGRFHRNEMLGNFQGQTIADRDPDFGSFVHQCCMSNNICGLAQAFDEGCAIDECDETSRTPLHYACASCSEEIVRILLGNDDVDANALDRVCFLLMIH